MTNCARRTFVPSKQLTCLFIYKIFFYMSAFLIFSALALGTVGDTSARFQRPINAIDLTIDFATTSDEISPHAFTAGYLKTLLAGLKVSVQYERANGVATQMMRKIPLSVIAEFTENGAPVTRLEVAEASGGKLKVTKAHIRLHLGHYNLPMQRDSDLVVTIHVETARTSCTLSGWTNGTLLASETYEEITEVTMATELDEKAYPIADVDFILFPYSDKVTEIRFTPDRAVSINELKTNWQNLRMNDLLNGDTSYILGNMAVQSWDGCICVPAANLTTMTLLKGKNDAYTFYVVRTKSLGDEELKDALILNGENLGGQNNG